MMLMNMSGLDISSSQINEKVHTELEKIAEEYENKKTEYEREKRLELKDLEN